MEETPITRGTPETPLYPSRMKNETLAESFPEAMTRFDREFRYLYINPTAEKLLGHKRENLIGKSIRELGFLPGILEPVLSNIASVFETGKAREAELEQWGRALNVQYVPEFDDNGTVVSVLSISRDVTELKTSRERLRQILESISDGFFALDRAWRFTYINRRGAENVGFKPEDLLGENVWDKFPLMAGTEHEKRYRAVMDDRIPATFELWSQDHVKCYNINVYPSDDGISVFWTDITGRVQAEEALFKTHQQLEARVQERTAELLKAQKELERSRRLSDIGKLAATMAHEIRNPLAGIKAAAYNLRRKAGDPCLEKHFLTIDKKIDESDRIIKNLLSYSRIRSINPEAIHAVSLLRECVKEIGEKYAGWDVAVEEHYDGNGDGHLDADPVQLRMLFRNIIDNAYQSLPDKRGTLSVTAQFVDSRMEVRIADSGAGLEPEDLSRIFDPFFTKKSKGAGLGLTLCREIVTLHNGTIEVESIKGTGTTFTVILPRTERPAEKNLPA